MGRKENRRNCKVDGKGWKGGTVCTKNGVLRMKEKQNAERDAGKEKDRRTKEKGGNCGMKGRGEQVEGGGGRESKSVKVVSRSLRTKEGESEVRSRPKRHILPRLNQAYLCVPEGVRANLRIYLPAIRFRAP